MSKTEGFLSRLEKVQGRYPRWRAICPAHESRRGTRSLSILETEDGRLLVHCHAGCSFEQVVRAAGVEIADLMPDRPVSESARPIRKPWRASDVVRALQFEAMVGVLLLLDIGNGKVITKSDRERARICAERMANLMHELGGAA
jgi:hypothetical protein